MRASGTGKSLDHQLEVARKWVDEQHSPQ